MECINNEKSFFAYNKYILIFFFGILLFLCYLGCRGGNNKSSESWEQVAVEGKKPSPREPEHVFWSEGKFYLFGGYYSEKTKSQHNTYKQMYYDDLWMLDENTMKWEEIQEKKNEFIKLSKSIGVLANNKYYFFGGMDYKDYSLPDPDVVKFNKIGIFDPDTKQLQYTSIPDRAPKPQKINYISWNGSSIIHLVHNDNGPMNQMRNIWKYDTEHNKWKKVLQQNSLQEVYNQSIDYSGAFPKKPNRLIFGAGEHHLYCIILENKGNIDKLYQYSFENNTWEVKNLQGRTPETRASPVYTWTGDYFIMYGGRRGPDYGGAQTYYEDLWICDPEKGKWIKINVGGKKPDIRNTDSVWTGKYLYLIYGWHDTGEFKDTIWRIDLDKYIK